MVTKSIRIRTPSSSHKTTTTTQAIVMWITRTIICLLLMAITANAAAVIGNPSGLRKRNFSNIHNFGNVSAFGAQADLEKRYMPDGYAAAQQAQANNAHCARVIQEHEQLLMKARDVYCPISEHADGSFATDRCALPFKNSTYGDSFYEEFSSCKQVEESDTFVTQGLELHGCPTTDSDSCHYWCPLETDTDGHFSPERHRWAHCHPKECQVPYGVCLSVRSQLCIFPYSYQSTMLGDTRPVKHTMCTNADEAAYNYWCPTSVSNELDPEECTPKIVYHHDICDLRYCNFENGNDNSVQPGADEYYFYF